MAWNGSGAYVLPPAYSPEVNGTTIDATRYNGLTTDVAGGITAALAKNGENVPTANLPMGGFKHTGAAAGTSSGQYLVYGQGSAVLDSVTVTTTSTFTGAATFNANPTGRVSSGTWTATHTNFGNIAAFTWRAGKYLRIGDQVSFSGTFTCQLITAGFGGLGVSLPIASAFATQITDAVGTVSGYGLPNTINLSGFVEAAIAQDQLYVNYGLNSTNVWTIGISGIYTIL